MTANALAKQSICSFSDLSARDLKDISRMYGVGNKGVADIEALLLRHATAEAAKPPSLACYSDDALVMELLRRGYRIDRPDR